MNTLLRESVKYMAEKFEPREKDVPTVTYNWPADPETLKNTPGEQLAEVLKQADFVEEALVDQSVDGRKIDDLLAQLHHDIESFWRALARRNGQEYVDMIFQRHEESLKAKVA